MPTETKKRVQVGQDLRLKCPDCQSHTSIDIDVEVSARLKQYSRDGEDFGTDADESRDGSHEWGETSQASCECGWSGKVGMLMRGKHRNHDAVSVGECCGICNHYSKDCVGRRA